MRFRRDVRLINLRVYDKRNGKSSVENLRLSAYHQLMHYSYPLILQSNNHLSLEKNERYKSSSLLAAAGKHESEL